jgi:hypothetical protein
VLGIEKPVGVACPQQSSEYARWIQSSLNTILGLQLSVDGVMNAATRTALRTFQQRNGLLVDGIAGPETKKSIVKARAEGSSSLVQPGQDGMTEQATTAQATPTTEEVLFDEEYDSQLDERLKRTPTRSCRCHQPILTKEMEGEDLEQVDIGKQKAQPIINPDRVSCARRDKSLPIFKAIGTTDPTAVLETVNQRAIALLDHTIAELKRIRERVSAGEPPAWPLIGDLLAWSLKTRMLMRVNERSAWIGRGPRTAEQIVRWLANIRRTIAGGYLRYTCLDASVCGPTTWAWVLLGRFRINFCRAFWHPKPGIDAATHLDFQAQTIIHEVSHIYYETEDKGRGPGHAECISQFVADANGLPIDEDFIRFCGPRGPKIT